MNPFELVQAESIKEAVAAMEAKPDARFKAAGVDLLDEMKAFVATPSRVVNLLKIRDSGMRSWAESSTALQIGALNTLSDIAGSKDLQERFPALAEAAREAATPEIRNMATIGGNLCQRPRCWYYRSSNFTCLKKGGDKCYAIEGDNKYHAVFDTGRCPIVHPSNLAPALIVLGATLEIEGPKGQRMLSVEEFFSDKDIKRENVLEHGEVILAIHFESNFPVKSAYREAREKQSFDWALASAAVAVWMDGTTCKRARVVLGAVAPTPKRREDVEKLLAGREITAKLAEEAGAKAAEGATPLSMNKYKVKLIKAVVRRAVMAAAGLKEE